MRAASVFRCKRRERSSSWRRSRSLKAPTLPEERERSQAECSPRHAAIQFAHQVPPLLPVIRVEPMRSDLLQLARRTHCWKCVEWESIILHLSDESRAWFSSPRSPQAVTSPVSLSRIMEQAARNKIVSWGIADDVLRDLFRRAPRRHPRRRKRSRRAAE